MASNEWKCSASAGGEGQCDSRWQVSKIVQSKQSLILLSELLTYSKGICLMYTLLTQGMSDIYVVLTQGMSDIYEVYLTQDRCDIILQVINTRHV